MLSTSAETMVVGPNGRVFLAPPAMEILFGAIKQDDRLWKTADEFEFGMIVKVPELELDAFCDALHSLLESMSPAEQATPAVQQLAALYASHYVPGRSSIADVA